MGITKQQSKHLRVYKWIQRDIEDQIEEEYAKLGMEYQRTEKQLDMAIPTISVQEVLKLLEDGYTRTRSRDRGYGSIQEKFDLTTSQLTDLFSHPKLKGKKTKFPRLHILDNEEEPERGDHSEKENQGDAVVHLEDSDIFS